MGIPPFKSPVPEYDIDMAQTREVIERTYRIIYHSGRDQGLSSSGFLLLVYPVILTLEQAKAAAAACP